MKKEVKIVVSNLLIIFGILCLVSGIIMIFLAREVIFGIISMFVVGIISLIVGSVIWKNIDFIVKEQPGVKKINKPKHRKSRRHKKSFKNYEKQDDKEDDEMTFIEEIMEDD